MTNAEQRLTVLEAQAVGLRHQVALSGMLLDAVRDEGYLEGRESILSTWAAPRPPRPRHLQVMNGGAR